MQNSRSNKRTTGAVRPMGSMEIKNWRIQFPSVGQNGLSCARLGDSYQQRSRAMRALRGGLPNTRVLSALSLWIRKRNHLKPATLRAACRHQLKPATLRAACRDQLKMATRMSPHKLRPRRLGAHRARAPLTPAIRTVPLLQHLQRAQRARAPLVVLCHRRFVLYIYISTYYI